MNPLQALQQQAKTSTDEMKSQFEAELTELLESQKTKLEAISASLEKNLNHLSSIALKRNEELLQATEISKKQGEHLRSSINTLNGLQKSLNEVINQSERIGEQRASLSEVNQTIEQLKKGLSTTFNLSEIVKSKTTYIVLGIVGFTLLTLSTQVIQTSKFKSSAEQMYQAVVSNRTKQSQSEQELKKLQDEERRLTENIEDKRRIMSVLNQSIAELEKVVQTKQMELERATKRATIAFIADRVSYCYSIKGYRAKSLCIQLADGSTREVVGGLSGKILQDIQAENPHIEVR